MTNDKSNLQHLRKAHLGAKSKRKTKESQLPRRLQKNPRNQKPADPTAVSPAAAPQQSGSTPHSGTVRPGIQPALEGQPKYIGIGETPEGKWGWKVYDYKGIVIGSQDGLEDFPSAVENIIAAHFAAEALAGLATLPPAVPEAQPRPKRRIVGKRR